MRVSRRRTWALLTLFALLVTLSGCGRKVSERDRTEAALARARAASNHPRAVELSRHLVVLAREFPPVDSAFLLRSYDLLQQALADAGNYQDALAYQEHLIGLLDGMGRPDSAQMRRVLEQSADCARRFGRREQAGALLTRAASLHGLSHYADPVSAARVFTALATSYAEIGRLELAEQFQRIALEVCESIPDTTELLTERARVARADYLGRLGRSVEAESLYVRALAAGVQKYGEDHPLLAPLYFAHGDFLHEKGRHEVALPVLEHGIRLAAASPEYDAGDQALQLHTLSGSAARIGRWDDARAAAERALAIRQSANPSPGPLPRTWVKDLAIVYLQLGRTAAAESLLALHPEKPADPER